MSKENNTILIILEDEKVTIRRYKNGYLKETTNFINKYKSKACVLKNVYDILEKIEAEKEFSYNAKVVCISSQTKKFTKGKIYEVIDGDITTNFGKFPAGSFAKFKNIDDINKTLRSKFVELVE